MRIKLLLLTLIMVVLSTAVFATGTTEQAATEMPTITLFTNREPPPIPFEDTTIGGMLFEMIGARLDIEWTVGDAQTKYGVILASGDYPDSVAFDDNGVEQFMEAGALVKLTDYVAGSSRLERVYDAEFLEAHRDENGDIYYLSAEHADANNLGWVNGFYVQQAILEANGWPEYLTFDEYVDMLKRYAEENPTIDGQPVIGYIFQNKGWKFDSLTNPVGALAGEISGGGPIFSKESDGSWSASLVTGSEDERHFFERLNELYLAGLLDEEGFVHSDEQYTAKLASGRVLGGYMWYYQTRAPYNALREAGMGTRRVVHIPVTFNKGITDPARRVNPFSLDGGFAITTAADDPDFIWDTMIETWLTDEVQTLVRWGVEGEQYEIDDDGMYYMTDEQKNEFHFGDEEQRRAFGLLTWRHWPRPSGRVKMNNGNYYYPNNDPAIEGFRYQSLEPDIEYMDAYGIDAPGELYEPVDTPSYGTPWTMNIPEGPAAVQKQLWDDFRRAEIPKLVLAEAGEFDAAWETYVRKFEAMDLSDWLARLAEVANYRRTTGNPAANPE